MRKWSKRLCWQPRFAREGRAVSSLRVRWKRSCRPFCSGLDQPVAFEELGHGASCRPVLELVTAAEVVQDRLCTPARMLVPSRHQQLDHFGAQPLRRTLRGPRPVSKPFESVDLEPFEELVAGLAADLVLLAQGAKAVEPAAMLNDELGSLSHGRRLLPRHGNTYPVRHASRSCHPCRWT